MPYLNIIICKLIILFSLYMRLPWSSSFVLSMGVSCHQMKFNTLTELLVPWPSRVYCVAFLCFWLLFEAIWPLFISTSHLFLSHRVQRLQSIIVMVCFFLSYARCHWVTLKYMFSIKFNQNLVSLSVIWTWFFQKCASLWGNMLIDSLGSYQNGIDVTSFTWIAKN